MPTAQSSTRRFHVQAAMALAIAAASFACLQKPALAAEQPAQSGALSGQAIPQDPDDVIASWTLERMRNAQPLDGPEAPAPAPAAAAAAPHALAASPGQEVPAARDTAYPERVHGRLFLKYEGNDASCSATVVTSRNRNLILTAGHCVATPTQNGPVWATDVVFVPGYRDGATPLGVWAGQVLRAPVLWSFEADLSYDVGTVTLAPSGFGQIEDVLGSRGIGFNRPGTKYKRGKTRFQIFGYPAQPSAFYNGERPILCNSPFRGFEPFTSSVVAAPCNMQEGSSGGGWVLNGGILNSVMSHNGCGIDPNCKFVSGTYLGTTAFKLWAHSGGGIAKGRKKRLRGCRKKRGGKKFACIGAAETFKPTVR